MLVDPPQVDRLMAHAAGSITAAPVQYTLMTRVFGTPDSPELERKFFTSWKGLTAPVEKLFLNDAAATAALERARILEKANSFVTFTSDRSLMKHWERSADIRVTSSGGVQKVEASLQNLSRDFGACVAIPQLYGRDFMARYPQVLDDLWKFDNDLFPLMMIGIPAWAPLKIVREGRAARSRIMIAIEGLYRRIDQHQHGKPIDFNADMSDVSDVALTRSTVYEKHNWTFPERGACDLALLWGQNANTQPVVFWLLAYMYSTPGLLPQIREEIVPYLSTSTSGELTALDIPGLSKNCQLLKACVFETYRLAIEVTSIRHVSRPITLTDGERKHELKPGSFFSAPLSLVNHDASVYRDPDIFDPTRFLEQNDASGKPVARYGKLKPWGSGAAMCKGRTFAEKEIMVLGAAIAAAWDIEPAGGKWELPAMVPGTGAKKPVRDVRVVITRRKWE
ncbi:uncharacterized protein N0V89_010501 [Didymosphaeria variabile]|uniref:Cytochrome P450 n=1 Tax=Didymosphaeria variabile TaxID=1932322 RepID=A0A9W8XBR8_9PLEO|nr:uncharacterized protein N0V89_010501 [Didymosphaeria variabile]KAJ4346570.1 hypothetical protein N0V89_010501 [Didymosphaeria variabile]